MKLLDVKVSFPRATYSVNVTHCTSRHTTAFEWLVLQTIDVSSRNNQFSSMSFSSLLEKVFCITDSNSLFKPVILSLIDAGMIRVNGLVNNSDLNDISMSEFSLTKEGKRLMADGMLPGLQSNDVINLSYDFVSKNLSSSLPKGLTEDPAGVSAVSISELSCFPQSKVHDYLNNNKGFDGFSWLLPTTQIVDLEAVESTVLWRNTVKKLDVSNDLQCKVDGINDSEVLANVLNGLELSDGCSMRSKSITSLSDSTRNVSTLDNFKSDFVEAFKASNIVFVAMDWFEWIDECISSYEGQVVVVCNADETKTVLDKGGLIIYVKDCIIEDGVIAVVSDSRYIYANAELFAGDYSRTVSFVVNEVDKQFNLVSNLPTIAEKYCASDSLMLLPLFITGQSEEACSILSSLNYAELTIPRVNDLIINLNAASLSLFGFKCLDDSRISVILEPASKAAFSNHSYSEIVDEVKHIYSEIEIKPNDDFVAALFDIAMSSLSPSETVGPIQALWSSLNEIDNRLVKRSFASDTYRRLYTDSAIGDITASFNSEDFYLMEAYTPIEQAFLQLRQISDSVFSCLGLDRHHVVKIEDARYAYMQHRVDLKSIHADLRNWITYYDVIGSKALDEEEGNNFSIVKDSMGVLIESMKPFYDGDSIKYNDVCVIDTCTLMHDSEFLALFEQGHILVIVPKIVLNELDNLKQNQDEEIAFEARSAIREVNNHKAFAWLSCSEDSYPDLLPDDLDASKPDYRILSIALKYFPKSPILITDDVNLQNIASAQFVESMSASAYRDYFANRYPSVKKAKKKKGKGGKR